MIEQYELDAELAHARYWNEQAKALTDINARENALKQQARTCRRLLRIARKGEMERGQHHQCMNEMPRCLQRDEMLKLYEETYCGK